MSVGKTLKLLIWVIVILAAFASVAGIGTSDGTGEYFYRSIRGEIIPIYGKGIYQHMSAEVAIQGIAQDYVTLFIGLPILVLSFYFASKGSIKARFILFGTLGYIFVTYLFYLVMAMYNQFFLVYSALMGTSFFGLMITASTFNRSSILNYFKAAKYTRFAAYFLMINSICIAILWLSIVVPPLANGSIYPKAVEHYTTLIVQGIDLGLLLPLSWVSGYLLLKKEFYGFLLAPAYLVFLSLLMIALNAKIIYLGIMGYPIIPAVFIIPTLALLSIICTFLLIRGRTNKTFLRNA
jgi:hypothetical protein